MNKIHITAHYLSRQVRINGTYLKPNKSQSVIRHSPDGFAWGYSGSGPSQLALAICIRIFGEDKAVQIYQRFKELHVSRWPQNDLDFEFNVLTFDEYRNEKG